MSAPVSFSIDAEGWLAGVRRRVSPNHDARSPSAVIDTLVVHGITLPPGQFGHDHVAALFTNTLDTSAHASLAELADVRVSAHAVIERTGHVTQYVAFDRRAWHAGVSAYDGRERVNDFAVGIELEGTDECPYTPWQYRALAAVTGALLTRYPALTSQRIVGHSDIAPGRKTDPGPAFDWAWFSRALETACI